MKRSGAPADPEISRLERSLHQNAQQTQRRFERAASLSFSQIRGDTGCWFSAVRMLLRPPGVRPLS